MVAGGSHAAQKAVRVSRGGAGRGTVQGRGRGYGAAGRGGEAPKMSPSACPQGAVRL